MSGAYVFLSESGCDRLGDGTFPEAPDSGPDPSPGVTFAARLTWWYPSEDGRGIENSLFRITRDPVSFDSAGWTSLGRDPDFDQARTNLSIFTAALIALADLERYVLTRPHPSQAEITRCERLLRNPLSRPFTGRGARLNVVEPWLDFLDGYGERLERIRASLAATRARPAPPGPPPPSRVLLESLDAVNPDRDIDLVLPELLNRLNQLRRRTEDVSDDIGHIGTLAAVASLVARSNALAVVVAAVAVILYYSGYRIGATANKALDLLRGRTAGRRRDARRLPDDGEHPEGDGISEALSATSDLPVEVNLNPMLSPAESSAAIRLWLRALCRKGSEALDTVSIRTEAPATGRDGVVRIVAGGPIVRVPLPADHRFSADLARDALGWHMRGKGRTICRSGDCEGFGLISNGRMGDNPQGHLLLACGFRDTGGVRALRLLEAALTDASLVAGREWIAVPDRPESGYPPL